MRRRVSSRGPAGTFHRRRRHARCLAALKQRIAASKLKANMAALRSRHAIPLEESIKETRQQVDNAATLGLTYLLTFGVDRPEEYDHYYKVMSDTAAPTRRSEGQAGDEAARRQQRRCRRDHRRPQSRPAPQLQDPYDAGNIIYYTGKDPIEELKPIAKHVTGFCAKDCGAVKGDVMIQFGTGKVDFAGVFATLKAAGFDGPLMVECCKVGATAERRWPTPRQPRVPGGGIGEAQGGLAQGSDLVFHMSIMLNYKT